MKNRKTYFTVFLILALLIASCTQGPPLKLLTKNSYPDFEDDLNYADLKSAIKANLGYLKKIPENRLFTFGEDKFSPSHIKKSLEVFLKFTEQNPDKNKLKNFINSNYLVYRAKGGKKTQKVLFTGYYEPVLKGSLVQTEKYKYPLYAPPRDLVIADLSKFSKKLKGRKIIGRIEKNRFVPYYDRKDIEEKGALKGKAKELVWLNDPVDVFFLHIQGSGKIELEDGRRISVHYHTKNGRPYKSIGKLLIKENKIPGSSMSMQKIREYLRKNPQERDRILNHNPSYIFFSIVKDGPMGAINVKLTQGRSIAIDPANFPLGALAFIKTRKPVPDENCEAIAKWNNLARFVLSQDTGGAIKGPGRADIFWGSGSCSGLLAGHIKEYGDLFFLVLKPGGN